MTIVDLGSILVDLLPRKPLKTLQYDKFYHQKLSLKIENIVLLDFHKE